MERLEKIAIRVAKKILSNLSNDDKTKLRQTIFMLSGMISDPNASAKDVEEAINNLRFVQNSLKKVQLKKQLDPKAEHLPLRSVQDWVPGKKKAV
jgi:hypothetical protein